VVCGDIAEYERGSTGEQTQGAGAVALLVEDHARLFEMDLRRAGSASAYRGPDFRKPFARHFMNGYTENVTRMHDFPVFSGKYSTYAYIDETLRAVENMLEKLGVSGRDFYRDVFAMFFHRPYHAMPLSAMSFLQVLSLAYGDSDALARLCEQAKVSVDTVLSEARSTPDLYGTLLERREPVEPYPAMNAAAAALRKSPEFDALTRAKMNLGADLAMDLGNLYTAALPAWLCAGFTDALEQELELAGKTMLAVGYGSGDAAEAIPLAAVEGWQEAAQRIGFRHALSNAVDLTQEQYEALHDGLEVPDLAVPPREEFVISRVGEKHDAAFQDLGVEYYEYVA
jgi:hydroxymethylglutaryl-CoA synthase